MAGISPADNKRRTLKKFRRYLSSAPKLEFLLAIYFIQQIQNSRVGGEKFFLDLPKTARTTDQYSKSYLHPWFLETLANELLAAPWNPRRREGLARTINPRSFNALATAYSLLNKAENACDGPVLRRMSVLTQLNRLGKHQFEWQRRFSTASRLARYHSIYRTDNSRIFFKEKYDLDFDTFTKSAFALYAVLLSQPAVRSDINPESIQVKSLDMQKTLDILSTTIEMAPDTVRKLRDGYDHIGYAPSIFRVSPLITFSQTGMKYATAPFVDLLFYRITEGLFYDFAGESTLRNEFSANLEFYVSDILNRKREDYTIDGNIPYGRTMERTPDVLISWENSIVAAIEIKARRQNASVRFGENPMGDSAGAYDDLSKGVFQLWKYLADSRSGLIPAKFSASSDTILAVCTLDNWLETAHGEQEEIYAMAHRRADSSPREIPRDCRKRVPIFSLSDMEFVLSRVDMGILLETIRYAATDAYDGWLLASIFSSNYPTHSVAKDTLPLGDVDRHVPWWRSLERDRIDKGAESH